MSGWDVLRMSMEGVLKSRDVGGEGKRNLDVMKDDSVEWGR